MRLYLSSYRLGAAKDQLLPMVDRCKRIAIIENALDMYSNEHRAEYKSKVYDPYKEFSALGAEAKQFDLRLYIGNTEKLRSDLESFGLVWVLGGNAFILRRAMKQSHFDSVISNLLAQDSIMYGGFSAGALVAGTTLKGIHLMDDPSVIPQNYSPLIIWDGLNLVPFTIIPHYQSLHPESASADLAAQYMVDNKIDFRTMRDGDVIIYENGTSRYVNAT